MKLYFLKLGSITAILAAIWLILMQSHVFEPQKLVFIGLLFLAALTGLLWFFVNGNAKRSSNAVIRRMMVASMLRLIGAAIFLIICMLTKARGDVFFAISYFIFFCVFLVFEIWETRRKLRPDSNNGPN